VQTCALMILIIKYRRDKMGPITLTGALIIIIGWLTLIEFDSYPDSKRDQIMNDIKRSPALILLIALMALGIFIIALGTYSNSLWMRILGSTLIVSQGIIAAIIFWNRKRWKSVILFVTVIGLGIFIYLPLF